MATVVDFTEAKRRADKPSAPARTRFEALDILRGLFLIGMLLANNAGDWGHIYKPFDHAEWHGFTMTDMVFPGFMVCVGLSMSLSLGRRMAAGGKAQMAIHALRRAGILVGIGLFLNLLPNFDIAHWRIPGVLQRIGVCYGLATGLLLLHSHQDEDGRLVVHSRALAGWAAGLLIVYGALLPYVPVPGFGANHFDAVMSWPAFVDRLTFGPDHIWREAKTYDPEGVLSTFPAVFNILAGLLVGLLIKAKTPAKATGQVFWIGFILIVLGLALDPVCPIIKKLWTPSFALLTSGIACVLLSLLMLIMDRLGYTRWAMPIRVLGTNAILAYVFAWLLAIALDVTGVYAATTGWLLNILGDPYVMSLSFAVLVLIVCWLFVLPFYLKRIFLKV
jgi:predicted acyltransferase